MKIYASKINLITSWLFFFISAVTAQNYAPKEFAGTPTTRAVDTGISKTIRTYKTVLFPSKNLAQFLNKNEKVALQINLGKELLWNIELEPSNIVASNYTLTIQTPEGDKVVSSNTDFLYKGKVLGDNGGEVRLAVKEGFVYGFFTKNNHQVFIEPLSRHNSNALPDEYIIYNANDVVQRALKCGVNDVSGVSKKGEGEALTRPAGITTNICKRLSILNITDYTIYQKYGNSVEAVEDFLLANLNNTESVYKNFNFDTTTSSDVGNDNIQFEIVGSYISTCRSCDVVDSSNNGPYIINKLRTGILKNLNYLTRPYPFIPHFWTMRNLYSGNPISGVSGLGVDVMKHFDDALSLRLVCAHETGHSLGCSHDNEMLPGVTGFIMQASATVGAVRFSQLTDFGSLNYSSNLKIKDYINYPYQTFFDCSIPYCENVTGIKLKNFSTTDSIEISWNNAGKFRVRYKLKDSINFNADNTFFVDGNKAIIRNLLPCTNYTFQIQQACSGGSFGAPASLTINTSPLKLTNFKAIHKRNDLYDLEAAIDGDDAVLVSSTLTLDHKPLEYSFSLSTHKLIIANLFEDGARHRIDITNAGNTAYCAGPFYYNAPYYRENSTEILAANFNNCSMPTNWKDSVISNPVPGGVDPFWRISPESASSVIFEAGTYDSSCMIYRTNTSGRQANGTGTLSLLSPVVNISGLQNVMLSFDYQFISYFEPYSNASKSNFKVEVYNGTQWVNIFEPNVGEHYDQSRLYRKIMDTLPPRIFLPLDKYRTTKFQLRFISDEPSFPDSASIVRISPLFLALENIKIDGYDSVFNNLNNKFTIFPNPSGNEFFIKITPGIVTNMQYKIIDAVGKTIQKGELENYRLNIGKLSKATYFLLLYKNNGQYGQPLKFVKQ
jgi:hypothetical protein